MKRKFKWIVCIVLVVLLGFLMKGCIKNAKEDVQKNTTLYEVETGMFPLECVIEAEVVPRKEVFQMFHGNLVETYVEVGDEVKKKTKLAKIEVNGKKYVEKAEQEGEVMEISEQGIRLSTKGKVLSFYLPEKLAEKIQKKEDVIIRTDDRELTCQILQIASQATYLNQKNQYRILASLPNDSLRYGMKLVGKLELENEDIQTRIPLDATVQVNGNVYVIFPSWLSHTMELEEADYQIIDIQDVNDGMVYLVNPLSQKTILRFQDSAYFIISTLCKELP